MFTKSRFRILPALLWTYPVLLWSGAWAATLTGLHTELGLNWLRLPALPVTLLGTAVAFYLGFKGNAAYERMWEARKIWGGIVNTSRTWGVFVTSMVTDRVVEGAPDAPLADVHRELVYRHVAWLGALRTQLLRTKQWEHVQPWNDEYRKIFGTFDTSDEVLANRVRDFVDAAELEALMRTKNRATQLLQRQGQRLKELRAEGRVEDFRHMELARLVETCFTLQGQAERIKNFPLPRQYATANHWFVTVFILLLPLALIGAFEDGTWPDNFVWVTVPVSMLMAWVYHLWDRVVDYTENPFEGLINDIPMGALSRTIEIDLREMLGETELPPPVLAVDGEALF